MFRRSCYRKRTAGQGPECTRLTPAPIDHAIVGEAYRVFPGTTLTVCCLMIRNGFTATGQSAAASVDNFDAEVGRKIACANGREQIWAFEGYLLREKLHRATQAARWCAPADDPV